MNIILPAMSQKFLAINTIPLTLTSKGFEFSHAVICYHENVEIIDERTKLALNCASMQCLDSYLLCKIFKSYDHYFQSASKQAKKRCLL